MTEMFERTLSASRAEIVEGDEPTTEMRVSKVVNQQTRVSKAMNQQPRVLKAINQQLRDENVEGDEPTTTTTSWQQCNKKK